MKISKSEIARVGLYTEGAVRAAVSNGRLDMEDLSSVMSYCLSGRLRALGIEFIDELDGRAPSIREKKSPVALVEKFSDDGAPPIGYKFLDTTSTEDGTQDDFDPGYTPMTEDEFGA